MFDLILKALAPVAFVVIIGFLAGKKKVISNEGAKNILVVIGFKLPLLATDSLKLLGDISGGLALFTLGVLLSFLKFKIDREVVIAVVLKNFAMPALVVGLALIFMLDSTLAKGLVIIAACPAATMGAMLSSQFSLATEKIPSQILASNICAIFTMGLWIYIAETLF